MRLRKDAKLELLRQVPLFAGCSKRELGEIATLADELSLPAGTTLIEEGRQGHEFFVLVEGEVDVRRKGRKLSSLGDGAFFGEMALVSSRPRNATVTATSPVRVLVVHEPAFRRLLRDSQPIQLKVLQTLADRAAENSLQ
ncbi:MAG: cyclic nucleotide-binding domain-containing protein [Gaiellaceae bacterium]